MLVKQREKVYVSRSELEKELGVASPLLEPVPELIPVRDLATAFYVTLSLLQTGLDEVGWDEWRKVFTGCACYWVYRAALEQGELEQREGPEAPPVTAEQMVEVVMMYPKVYASTTASSFESAAEMSSVPALRLAAYILVALAQIIATRDKEKLLRVLKYEKKE